MSNVVEGQWNRKSADDNNFNTTVYNEYTDLQKLFGSYPPFGDKEYRYDEIKNMALLFGRTILKFAPKCADRTAAIRKIREAVWTAMFAIESDLNTEKYNSVTPERVTSLAQIPDSLKMDSWNLLYEWLEENMKPYMMYGCEETVMNFIIRIMTSWIDTLPAPGDS